MSNSVLHQSFDNICCLEKEYDYVSKLFAMYSCYREPPLFTHFFCDSIHTGLGVCRQLDRNDRCIHLLEFNQYYSLFFLADIGLTTRRFFVP